MAVWSTKVQYVIVRRSTTARSLGRVWGTTGGRRQPVGSSEAGESIVLDCLEAQLNSEDNCPVFRYVLKIIMRDVGGLKKKMQGDTSKQETREMSCRLQGGGGGV